MNAACIPTHDISIVYTRPVPTTATHCLAPEGLRSCPIILKGVALSGQLCPAQAATAQTIEIILDNTGSMTETGMAGVSTTWKWDDAIMAAYSWVQRFGEIYGWRLTM